MKFKWKTWLRPIAETFGVLLGIKLLGSMVTGFWSIFGTEIFGIVTIGALLVGSGALLGAKAILDALKIK